MGIIRVLLALAVIIQHTGPLFGLSILDGRLAVETFFMISGFYMALVLTEKYRPLDASRRAHWQVYKTFWEGRAWRLYPVFWVVLGIVFLTQLLAPHSFLGESNRVYPWQTHGRLLSPSVAIFLVVSNIALVGQDIMMFLTVSPETGLLHWTSNFSAENLPAWNFMLIPPAWSLGLEVTFYLLAPFLLRCRTSVLVVLMTASVLLRFALMHFLHWQADPWSYRFFPTEVLFFLLGAIGYRRYAKLRVNAPRNPNTANAAWGVMLGAILLYQFVPVPHNLKALLYLALFATALPYIFLATKQIKWDRYIGDLSYPIYISHYWVIWLTASLHWENTPVVIGVTLALSLLLLHLIDKPSDAARQRMIKAHLQAKVPSESSLIA